MTNVQSTRRRFHSGAVQVMSLAVIVMAAAVPSAHAQDLFSSSGTAASGGASQVMDVNRRSFGMNFRFGHAGGDTVGRQDSLTHMSLAPYFNTGPALVFADARLGRANKGGLTWSFGTGLRTFVEEWDVVTGANFYHSRDNITGANLQSWGVGVEVLSEDWETRLNYVQPNGTTSQLASQTIDQSSAAYAGNNIIFNRIDTIAEALEKVDVETGAKLSSGPLDDNVELRGFVGFYRFNGETIARHTGWKTRLQANVGEHLELGAGLHQDSLTETTIFFNAVVTFGGFKAQDYTKQSAIHRLADPVRRDLTVASLRTSVVVPGQVAIDPSDGLPLVVAHVDVDDAVGPFIGTVEDPLMSITSGLGVPGADVIFVHAGGLYNAAPDNQVTVGAGQELYGEGLITAASGDRFAENTVEIAGLGDLVLPSSPKFIASGMTLARPTLQNAVGNSVTLSDGSSVGGLIIDSAGGAGIFSNNVGGTLINDVLVQSSTGDGIHLFDTTGTTTIVNTIIDGSIGAAFHVEGGNGSIGFQSTSVDLSPSFANIVNSSQEAVLIENMLNGGTVNMTGATINDTGGTGIHILNNSGNATLDNVRITNSTSTGINIMNADGTITFRNTLGSPSLVSGSTAQAVQIDTLGASGVVNIGELQIDDRNGVGIGINANSGRIEFTDSVLIRAPIAGAAAAVSVTGSAAGSSVTFADALSISGSNGRGIELVGNLAGSQFNVLGQTSVTGTLLESIAVDGDGGTSRFGSSVVIDARFERGISIQNSTGGVLFEDATSVGNSLLATFAAVDIQGSEAVVLFDSLSISDTRAPLTGGAGINMVNNLAGAINTAIITFGDVNIQGEGTGVFGLNNTQININDGTIAMSMDAAVDLEESGWNINLESVSSTTSIDNGIRLVNAAPPDDNTFDVNVVVPIATAGSGGTISESAGPAVLLANAGQVELRGMLFNQNVSGVFLSNSGLADDDDQDLVIRNSSFDDTTGRVIDAQNLTTLVLEDSLITEENALVAGNTIQLTYTERTNDDSTTVFSEFDNPFEVFIRRNVIIDQADNVIVIDGLAGSEDAHIDVDIANNAITMSENAVGVDETAITFDWTGPSRVRLAANAITQTGGSVVGNNTGFDIDHLSTTDEMLLSIISNQFLTTDDDAIGASLRTLGQSDILIDANQFSFGGVNSTGIQSNLAPDTEYFLTNNQLRFDADGGAGVIFTLVNQPSVFTINNNQIGLTDDGALIEEGIRFLAGIGTSSLIGNQNNLVFLLNPAEPGAFIEIPSSFAGSYNGSIIINGTAQP